MTRLERTMAGLKAAGKKGLFIYITAGAPDIPTTLEAIKQAEQAGADVIELGLPFSDPLADGPVIQTASVIALKGGMTLRKALGIVREIRKSSDIPIIGMGYINNMLHYGLVQSLPPQSTASRASVNHMLCYGFEQFVRDFHEAGMDGVIIPDVPHEESGEMRKICAAQDFHLAEFITPGTTPERMKETCTTASGFVYCVSNYGVTGVKDIDYRQIGKIVAEARKFTKAPLAVGFGIGSPEAAVAAAAESDAVIVGSAVVKRLLDGQMPEAMALIADMRRALDDMPKA